MSNLYIEGSARDITKRSLAAAVYAVTGQTDSLRAELVMVDEQQIRTLNRDTRGVDAVTDVLSFPTLDGIRGRAANKAEFPFDVDRGRLFLGSVVICRARAREQAREYGHSLKRELHYLLAHGLLHLLGYDHMTEQDKAQMREKEELVMQSVGIGRDK